MPFLAWGWHFADGKVSNRTEMAASDAPRVETGHHYLIAVAWQEARCSPGDQPVPARWRALGSDAIVPYDEQTVGQGETEGHAQTVSQAAAKADEAGPDVPVEAQLAGKGGSDVRAVLQGTPVGKRLEFGRPASTTDCG